MARARTRAARTTTSKGSKLVSGMLDDAKVFPTGKGGGKKPDIDPPKDVDVKPKKKRKRERKSVAEEPYQRPKVQKKTKEKIWENAEKASPDGKVRDPLTGKVMDSEETWDAGHLPGWEFRKHKAAAEQYGEDTYPRSEFVKDYNDPDHYQPELPSSNQGHSGEAADDVDEWDAVLRNRFGDPPGSS